jgi:hypothetical protein
MVVVVVVVVVIIVVVVVGVGVVTAVGEEVMKKFNMQECTTINDLYVIAQFRDMINSLTPNNL